MEKTGMLLSRKDDSELSAKSSSTTKEAGVRAGDSASVALESLACSVQECKNALCFRDVGVVAENGRLAAAKDAKSVTEMKANEIEIRDGLEKGEDSKLDELRFRSRQRCLRTSRGCSRRLATKKWARRSLACSREGGGRCKCSLDGRNRRSCGGSVKKAGGEGGSSEGVGKLFRMSFDEANERVDTGGQGTWPDEVVKKRLHEGCSMSGEGFLAESCSHGVSQSGEVSRAVIREGVEEGVFEVSES